MKKLIYSQEDVELILSIETEEKDKEIERLNNIRKQALQMIINNWYEKSTIPIENVVRTNDLRVELYRVLIQGVDKE